MVERVVLRWGPDVRYAHVTQRFAKLVKTADVHGQDQPMLAGTKLRRDGPDAGGGLRLALDDLVACGLASPGGADSAAGPERPVSPTRRAVTSDAARRPATQRPARD
jgi:hypothetical protein